MDQQKQNNMIGLKSQDDQQKIQEVQEMSSMEYIDYYQFCQIYGNDQTQYIQSKSFSHSQIREQTNCNKTQNKVEQQKYKQSISPLLSKLNEFDIKLRKKYIQNSMKKNRKNKDKYKDKDNQNKSLATTIQKKYYYFQILDEQMQNQTGKGWDNETEKQDGNMKGQYQQKRKNLYKMYKAREKFKEKLLESNLLAKDKKFDRVRRNKFKQSKNIPNLGVDVASEPQKFSIKDKKIVNSLNTNQANKNINKNGHNNNNEGRSNIDLKLDNDGKYNLFQKQPEIENENQIDEKENWMGEQNAYNLIKIMDLDKPGLYSISVNIGLLEISINVFVFPMELTGIQRQISKQKSQNTKNAKKVGNFYQKQSQIYGKSYHFIPYFKPHQSVLLIRAAIQKYLKSLMTYSNQLATSHSSSSSSSPCLDLILDPLNQCAFIPSLCFDKEFIINSVANGRKYYQQGTLQFRKSTENLMKFLGKNGYGFYIFDQICYFYILDKQQDNLNKENQQKEKLNKKIKWKDQNVYLYITLAISKYHYLTYQTDFLQNVCNPYAYYLQTKINLGQNKKDKKFQQTILRPNQGCEAISSGNFFGCEANYQSSNYQEKSDQQQIRRQEKQYFQNLEEVFKIFQRFVLKKEYKAVFELFQNSSQNKTKQPIFKNNKQLLIFTLNHLHKNLQFSQYKQYLQKILKITQQTQQNPSNFDHKKANEKSLLSPTLRKNRKQLYLERRRSRSYSQSSKDISSPRKHHYKHEHEHEQGYKKLHKNSNKNENKDNNNQIQAYHRQYHQEYEYRYNNSNESQSNSNSSDKEQQENIGNKFVKNFNFNLKLMIKSKLFPFKNFCIQEKNRSQEDQEYKRKSRKDKKQKKVKADSSSSSEWSKNRVQDRIQDLDDLENEKDAKNKVVKANLPNKNYLKQQQQSNPLGKQYAYLFLPYENKNINSKKESQPIRSKKSKQPEPEKQQQLKKEKQEQVLVNKQENLQESANDKKQKKYLQLDWKLQFFIPNKLCHENYKMFVQMKILSALSENQWKHIWNMFQETQSTQYKMQQKQQLTSQNSLIMFQQLIPKVASYLLMENLNPILKLIKCWQLTLPKFPSQSSYFLLFSHPSTIADLPPETVLLESFLTNIIFLNLKSLSLSLTEALQQNCLSLCSIIFEQLSTIILLLYRYRLDRVTYNGLCLARVIYEQVQKIGTRLGEYIEKRIQLDLEREQGNLGNFGAILKIYELQSKNQQKISYTTNQFIESKSFFTMFPLYCNYILYLNQIQQLNRIINSFHLKNNNQTSSDKYIKQYNQRINQKINTSPSQLEKILNLYKKNSILTLLLKNIRRLLSQLSLAPLSHSCQPSLLQLSSSSFLSPVSKHKIFFSSLTTDTSHWLLTISNSVVIFQATNTQHLLYALQQYQAYTQSIYQQLYQLYAHLNAFVLLRSQCFVIQDQYLHIKQTYQSVITKPPKNPTKSQTTTSPGIYNPPILQPTQSSPSILLNLQQVSMTMLTNSIDRYRYIVSWHINWYMVDGSRIAEERERGIEEGKKADRKKTFEKLFKFAVFGRMSFYWVRGFDEKGFRGYWEWMRYIRLLELPQSITYNLKYEKSLSSQNSTQSHKILQNFQHLLDSLSPNSCLNSSSKSFSSEHLLVLLPMLLQKCFGSHQQAHLYTEYRDQIEEILIAQLKAVIYGKKGVEETKDLYEVFGNFCTNVIVYSVQYANKFRKNQEFLQIVQDYIYKVEELGQYIYQKCKKDYRQNLKQQAQLDQQNKINEAFKQNFKKIEKQLNTLQQKNKPYFQLILQDIGKTITSCSDKNLDLSASLSLPLSESCKSCTSTHIFLHTYLQLSKIATHILKIISAFYSLSYHSTNSYILHILQSCQKFLNYLPEELPNIQIQLLRLRYFCEKITMVGKGEIGSMSGNGEDIGKYEIVKNLYLKNRQYKYFSGFLMYLQIQAKKTSINKQMDKMQQFQAPKTHRQQQNPAYMAQWITLFEQQYTIKQILKDGRKQIYLAYLIQYLPSNYYKRLIEINIILPYSEQVLKYKQKQKQEQKQEYKKKQKQKQQQYKQKQIQINALLQKNSAEISIYKDVQKYENSVLYLAIQYLWKFKVQESNYVPIWSLIRIVSLQLYKIMKVRPIAYYQKIHEQQLLSKLHYALAKFYKIFLLSSPAYIPSSLSLPQFPSLHKIFHHFNSYYHLQSTTPNQIPGMNIHHNIHKMLEEYKGFGQKAKIYQAICGKCAKKVDKNQRKDGKEDRGNPFREVCGFLGEKIRRLRDNIQIKG